MQSDQKIELTITYMMEHLNRSLPVAELAALANISPSHYTALFKRRTGCAPIDYFIRLRMQRARELLLATALNVKEVAAALGYEDPFYFSRVFKSVNRLAPSYYRLRVGGSGPADIGLKPLHPEREARGALLSPRLPVAKQFENDALNGESTYKPSGSSSSVSRVISQQTAQNSKRAESFF